MPWVNESRFDAEIAGAASRHNVPVALIKAVIAVESGFKQDALNTSDPGYAWGLMQMIPSTARSLGYAGPMETLLTDPALAIDLGAKLLRQNLTAVKTVPNAVSAYNGGIRPSIGFGATVGGTYRNQVYVDRVLSALSYFESKGGVALGAASFPAPSVPDVAIPSTAATAARIKTVWAVLAAIGAFLLGLLAR